MKLQEITAYNLKTQRILNESWETLTESQRLYLGKWERELWPLVEQYVKLCEATLTPDQVEKIFQSAEEVAVAGGNNQTALGKAGSAAKAAGAGAVAAGKMTADLAKQVNAKINELGKLAQKAGPVKAMDQKFDSLKNTINKKFPDSKILDGISEIGIWAENNPGKASLAIGILTTIAALAGGPAGGAAAAFILKSTKELLTGAKLSTALGKSVKTAAYGAIAGWALEGLGDWLEGLRADAVPYEKVPGLTQIDVELTRSLTAPGYSLEQTLGSMVVPADQADEFMQLVNNARGGDVDAFKQLWQFTKDFDIQQAAQDINMNNQVLKELAIQNDEFLKNLTMANNAVAAIAQGTIAGKMDAKDIKVDDEPMTDAPEGEDDNPNLVRGNESLSMEEKYDLYLQEGPFDAIKQGAKAVGGAIKKGAAAVGKELGNKVTVAKLMKQWKAMGEPPDTGSVMNILQDAGLSTDQIGQIGQAAQVDLGAGTEPSQSDEPADANANSAQDTDTGAADSAQDVKTAPEKGEEVEFDGKNYQWLGAQWAEVNPATGKAGKMAEKGIVKALNDLAGIGKPQQAASQANEPAQDQQPAAQQATAGTTAPGKVSNFDPKHGVPLTAKAADAFTKSRSPEERQKSMASAKAAGYTFDNQTGIWTPPLDLKTLADEIKQAGPEVIQAVKAMLTAEPAAQAA